VDVVAAVGTDEEAAAVVEPSEGSFDDPAAAAEAGAVVGLATGDDRLDASLPDEAAVLVVVVAAVGDQRSRSAARPADPAAHEAARGRATTPAAEPADSLTGCALAFRT